MILSRILSPKPYKTGFALSGGGAKGLAEAGILKALEQAGIKPDLISGVSAGSIVGALYADGYSADDILDIFREVEFTQYAKMSIPRYGFFKINAFKKLIKTHLKSKYFEDLKLPLRVIATDMTDSKSVIFSSGELIDPLMASCSMPVLFAPIEINGHLYADGGVLRNLPVLPIKRECERVIGICVSASPKEELTPGIVNMARRSYQMMYAATMEADKQAADFLIEPPGIREYDTWDTDSTQEMFDMGYQYAKKIIEIGKLKL